MKNNYPRERRKQENTGGGMGVVSAAKRKVIGVAMRKAYRERNDGWPESVQREGIPHTYKLADEEWARLMFNSKMKSAKT